MSGAILFAILVLLAIGFVGRAIWLFIPRRDQVTERLQGYGLGIQEAAGQDDPYLLRNGRGATQRSGLEQRLAIALAQSDLRLKPAEFIRLVVGAGLLGFILGALRLNMIV